MELVNEEKLIVRLGDRCVDLTEWMEALGLAGLNEVRVDGPFWCKHCRNFFSLDERESDGYESFCPLCREPLMETPDTADFKLYLLDEALGACAREALGHLGFDVDWLQCHIDADVWDDDELAEVCVQWFERGWLVHEEDYGFMLKVSGFCPDVPECYLVDRYLRDGDLELTVDQAKHLIDLNSDDGVVYLSMAFNVGAELFAEIFNHLGLKEVASYCTLIDWDVEADDAVRRVANACLWLYVHGILDLK